MKNIALALCFAFFVACDDGLQDMNVFTPVIKFTMTDGSDLFDHPDYTPDIHIMGGGEPYLLDNFLNCYNLYDLGTFGSGRKTAYIDYGNGDIDTLEYRWEGGRETIIVMDDVNFVELYFNNKLAKRWEWHSKDERLEFIYNHANTKTSDATCDTTDPAILVKDL